MAENGKALQKLTPLLLNRVKLKGALTFPLVVEGHPSLQTLSRF